MSVNSFFFFLKHAGDSGSSVGPHAQGVFEAVGGRFLVALAVLLPPLAEEQGLLVQEQVPLHGLEAGQVLHLGVALLVLRPHAEGALHQQLAQLAHVTLDERGGALFYSATRCRSSALLECTASGEEKPINLNDFSHKRSSPHLVSRDGDQVHGVVDSLQDAQD